MRLPKKVKAKWLKALRSGDYKQTKHKLYNPKTGGFCCLGVLEHVCMDRKVECDLFGDFLCEPTKDFYDYADIDADPADADLRTLMDMNDGNKSEDRPARKFKTIANWIEKNIPTMD